MPSTNLPRRALLAASAAGVVGTAGCAGLVDRFREHPVAWRTDLDTERYLCSPLALADGRVLAMGENHLTGLDADSGERLWRSRFFDHVVDGPVRSGPITVVSAERSAAYRPDGTELWSLGRDEQFHPYAARGDVVVGAVGRNPPELAAVSATGGVRLWGVSLDDRWDEGDLFDAVGSGSEFVGALFDGRLLALDPDGKRLWHASNEWDGHGPGRPTLAAGTGGVVAASAAVAGFDPSTGERRWRHDLPDYAAGVAVADGVAHVAVGSDDLKVGSWDAPGGVLAFDLVDGRELWRARLSARARPPTVSGDTLWVGTGGGRLVAIDVDSGERRWRRTVGERVETAPLVTDDRVFVGAGTPAAGDPPYVVAVER